MSVRYSKRTVSTTQQLVADWVGGQSSDDVVISIYDMTDGFASVSLVAMTNLSGSLFNYAWTPTSEHSFMIDYFNRTLEVHDFEQADVEAA